MRPQAALNTEGILTSAYPQLRRMTAPSVAGWLNRVRGLAVGFSSLRLGTWVLLDTLLLFCGTYLGFQLFVIGSILPYLHVSLAQAWGVLGGAFVFASLVFGLYERETLLARSRILTRLMLTSITAGVITYAVVHALMYTTLSRRVVAMAVVMLCLVGGSIRLTACWALHRRKRGLLIVGPGSVSNSLLRAFKQGFLDEYRLVGFVDDAKGDAATSVAAVELPRLGTTRQLAAICAEHDVQDIVVGAEAASDSSIMNRALTCLRRGCRVTNEATFYEKATGQIPVDEINPHWFLFADLQVHCQKRQALKRAFDVVVAAMALVAALPLLPIIALLIKLDDGGPIFYSQPRVGQGGKLFRVFKFRTMRIDAESDTPVWAVRNDPRVTRVGRVLRMTRLDELPQLVNVLVGRMSLVGPRPERPDFVVQLTEQIPYYNERHLVKPGITGWAQIGFRYGSSVEDAKRKLQFDLYYLKHVSMELDLMILLRTLGVFLRGAC